MRAVARAPDGSVGRIYDGHLNAVERLSLAAPPTRCADAQLAAVAAGELLARAVGGRPGPGRGAPRPPGVAARPARWCPG